MSGSSGRVVSFRLPDVGEGLEEAEVVTWLVAEGDEVTRDQPLVEILTDKAQVELPSPTAGRVVRLGAAVGDVVKVGAVIVELDAGGGGGGGGGAPAVPAELATPAPATTAEVATATVVTAAPAPTSAPPTSTSAPGLRPKASPVTRRLAVQLGVDLGTVSGSGPGGRILAEDVRRASEGGPDAAPARDELPVATPHEDVSSLVASTTATPPPRTTGRAVRLGWVEPGQHPLRGIRRVTAEAMRRSWSEIPHITGMDEVDATALLAARDELRTARGEPLTPLALLALAACRALRRFPLVNASIDPEAGTYTVHDRINLGIAVATDDGLVVPVIHDAGQRGLAGLAAEINRAAGAARSKRLTPGDLRGGTFTITNYGAIGGRFATPLVRPGEVGILGFGAVRERAIAIDGRVEARPTLPVVFSADHRLIDGDLATSFQEQVLAYVRQPLTLLLEE